MACSVHGEDGSHSDLAKLDLHSYYMLAELADAAF